MQFGGFDKPVNAEIINGSMLSHDYDLDAIDIMYLRTFYDRYVLISARETIGYWCRDRPEVSVACFASRLPSVASHLRIRRRVSSRMQCSKLNR